MLRLLALVTLTLATLAHAQDEWAQPPPVGSAVPPLSPPVEAPINNGRQRPASLAKVPDTLRFGVQFHGELTGGTAGFGGSTSIGFGLARFALLLTPSLTLAPNANVFSLDLSARIYFAARQAGVLAGYIRPGAGVAFLGSTILGNASLGGGGEYLLTRNLGFTAELSVRVGAAPGALSGVVLNTIGSVGIMLHQ
jgi:hypothetical protein